MSNSGRSRRGWAPVLRHSAKWSCTISPTRRTRSWRSTTTCPGGRWGQPATELGLARITDPHYPLMSGVGANRLNLLAAKNIAAALVRVEVKADASGDEKMVKHAPAFKHLRQARSIEPVGPFTAAGLGREQHVDRKGRNASGAAITWIEPPADRLPAFRRGRQPLGCRSRADIRFPADGQCLQLALYEPAE